MKMMLDIDIKSPGRKINYSDKLMLVGSCFTEQIGKKLEDVKFCMKQNPSGILFDPVSVTTNLVNYIENKPYNKDDLFYLNELWQSWNHHSIFSGMDAAEVLMNINQAQQQAHEFLKDADWLIITLGSAFSYRLSESGVPVANCHRAPAQYFGKHLLTIEEIVTALDNCMHRLFHFNNKLQIIFTISPVRHIRDGVVENNRSKARLIEAVHHMVNKFDRLHYFPAYELVIDVLRDYRFYDVDLVHPNYPATEFVFQKFIASYIDEDSQAMMEEIKKIVTAYKHKPFQPGTEAHQNFLRSFLEKAKQFQLKYPHINLEEEIHYFSRRKAVVE
ncbi:GSCFA domain-containing protein [Aridibaculum aurantiacum]|uniref:GSCFA domain-containing protein n=1 Tax=Aridibaculum aurantiacum TaxID=2810307 RepID=UPI001A974A11|nr:GSCFA domain-containing protein [Aridibaculum aurantiacum]